MSEIQPVDIMDRKAIAAHLARLLAAGKPIREACSELGITQDDAKYMRTLPAFKEAWQDSRRRSVENALRLGIARREVRLEGMQRRYELLWKVIEERAREYEGMAPGAGTGLLVRNVRLVKMVSDPGGEPGQAGYREVEEWAVDTGLLKEMRSLEAGAASEVDETTNEGVKASLGVQLLQAAARVYGDAAGDVFSINASGAPPLGAGSDDDEPE